MERRRSTAAIATVWDRAHLLRAFHERSNLVSESISELFQSFVSASGLRLLASAHFIYPTKMASICRRASDGADSTVNLPRTRRRGTILSFLKETSLCSADSRR